MHFFNNVAKLIILYCYFVEFTKCFRTRKPIHGLYTNDIQSYQFLVPYKINLDGEIQSFFIPQFFKHDYQSRRRKRDALHPDLTIYNLHFNGEDHYIQLWPNHGFMSPDVITEFHDSGAHKTVENRHMKRLNSLLCHYTGKIKDDNESSVALSLCDGVAGYIKTKNDVYFIEPVKDFGPNELGHYLHVIHEQDSVLFQHKKRETNSKNQTTKNCGVNDLNDGWQKAFTQRYGRNSHKTVRGIFSMHKYLEILVVVDKEFLNFHKDKDYENYIMTVMNMVSNYFHDASLGEQFDVTVVRIVYLNEDIPAIDLSSRMQNDISTVLKKFCRWQFEINPKDLKHPQRHDIAIMITRHDICSNEKNDCDMLGIAYTASACIPSDACAINEDKGLILGVVISHEIGHIMGCEHDSKDTSGCSEMVDEKFYHVMSPHISLAATVWSTCSRTYMKELLKNNLGDCLTDEPLESLFVYDEILPGIVYDADYQCNLIFPKSTHCDIDSERFCQQLFCKVAPTICWTNNEPPAEGTKCGTNMWCSKQQCVSLGQRIQAIDGDWTEWSRYSRCSRSCGGGVKISERSCTNPAPSNGGVYCQGPNKRYKMCKTNDCPDEVPSFRAAQCSRYDRIPNKGKFHKWVPFFPVRQSFENTCVLYCINEQNVFLKLSPRVIDGTPCRSGTNDVCISGICHNVGCDWQLESDAVNDKCGVCNGDNSGCERVYGTYTRGGKGYSLMVTFPRGARNIALFENEPSDNTIIVLDQNKNLVLTINDEDGEKRFGKNLAYFQRSIQNREELYIAGPLQQSFLVYICFKDPNNVGFSWEFYIRNKNWSPDKKKKDKKNNDFYHWEYIDWTRCSARCDGGITKSEPHCIGYKIGGIISKTFCSNITEPQAKMKICNKAPCKLRWQIGEWSICSGCIHNPGLQVRRVYCGMESSRWDEDDIITDNEKCLTSQGPMPQTKQLCTSECNEECKKRRYNRRRNVRVFYKNKNKDNENNYYENKNNNNKEEEEEGEEEDNNNNFNLPSELNNKFYQNYYKMVDFIDLDHNGLIFGTEQIYKPSYLPEKHLMEYGILSFDRNSNENSSQNNSIQGENLKNRRKIQNLNVPYYRKYSLRMNSKFQKNYEDSMRNIRDSSVIVKPNHTIVIDKKENPIVFEVPYYEKRIRNYSDEGFQKYGDVMHSQIDLSHKKLFKDKKLICKTLQKYENFTDDIIEQSPSDNVDIPELN